ncbi:MAG: membrane protein insertion efficiency factor YidD, partial [Candidatus Cloacimonetes bacterium]|nr:membrane protein insertion efficiency factor YidD [Candidatus Cloacimonadota bacterium]
MNSEEGIDALADYTLQDSNQKSFDMATNVSLDLLKYYKKSIRPKSIERCMFHISCSNYAKQNIENKGFIPGLISFVDRHFYREHSAASTYYSWII